MSQGAFESKMCIWAQIRVLVSSKHKICKQPIGLVGKWGQQCKYGLPVGSEAKLELSMVLGRSTNAYCEWNSQYSIIQTRMATLHRALHCTIWTIFWARPCAQRLCYRHEPTMIPLLRITRSQTRRQSPTERARLPLAESFWIQVPCPVNLPAWSHLISTTLQGGSVMPPFRERELILRGVL